MADAALDPLNDCLEKRARGERLTRAEDELCLGEARGIDEVEAKGTTQGGGSGNIWIIATAALGWYLALAAMARKERRDGQRGGELGSPSTYYHGAVIVAMMVALRDARAARDADAVAAIEAWLTSIWLWDALVAVPVDWLSMRIYYGSTTPKLVRERPVEGVTPAVAGPRSKHGAIENDHHSEVLNHALDRPRRNRGTPNIQGTLLALLGRKGYRAPTSPEVWGLTAKTRELFVRITTGDVAAVQAALPLLFGTEASDHVTLERTTSGAFKIFWGNPGRNGPTVAISQVTTAGEFMAVQPDTKSTKSNEGYAVSRGGGMIGAGCDGSPWIAVPELGGDLLWSLEIIGCDRTNWRATPADLLRMAA